MSVTEASLLLGYRVIAGNAMRFGEAGSVRICLDTAFAGVIDYALPHLGSGQFAENPSKGGAGMPVKSSLKEKSKTEKDVVVKITPTVSDATPFYYCNYASVSHTTYEFVLTFVKIPTPFTDIQQVGMQKDGRLALEASVQIAVSPKFLPELIVALNEVKRKYEERFGPIEAGRRNAG